MSSENILSLNDDVLICILDFFEFDELFGVINLVNGKFNELALQLESNRLNQKIRDINVRDQETCTVTKKRKFRLPIEDELNLLGPYDISDCIQNIASNGMILIVEDNIYNIKVQNYFCDHIYQSMQIIGLPEEDLGIEIEMEKIQCIYRNVTFKNLYFSMRWSDPCFLSVYAYGHLQLYNCDFLIDEYYASGPFIQVDVAGYLTMENCRFEGGTCAIEIDNKANQIIIENCEFTDISIGKPHYQKFGCVEFSDMQQEQRRRVTKYFKSNKRKLTDLKQKLMIHCSENVFILLENKKHAFIETAWDRQITDSQCIFYDNHIENLENNTDPNKIHFVHPTKNSSYMVDDDNL